MSQEYEARLLAKIAKSKVKSVGKTPPYNVPKRLATVNVDAELKRLVVEGKIVCTNGKWWAR